MCVDDFDGDGVMDNDDYCLYVKYMSKISFIDYFIVDLYFGYFDLLFVWGVVEKVCFVWLCYNYV